MHTSDITLDELTKVEGSVGLNIKINAGKVENVQFEVKEYKRFYTEAMKGKALAALPQLLARICGTCSNAHLLCSILACENALGIKPTAQTQLLRHLTMYGLNIRDHALHLYLFVSPDIYNKDSFLDLDENDPEQDQILHDGFEIKAVGNYLATIIAGRSVHAINPIIGGFLKFAKQEEIALAITKLQAVRPAVLRCIEIFKNAPWHFDRQTNYMALLPENHYGFLSGKITSSLGYCIPEQDYREHLEHIALPYSQASAYKYKGEPYLVGALARMNLAKNTLHSETKKTLGTLLDRFPSTDIFNNNLAQAIEILHCVDHSLEILQTQTFVVEPVIKKTPSETVGVGVVEAPRGTLYHKIKINADGLVAYGEVIVPTGQNQINIEKDIASLVENLLPKKSKEEIISEIEKLIRAYDPCMSCAAHFLKVNWSASQH